MKIFLLPLIVFFALTAQTQPFKILDEIKYGTTIQELTKVKNSFSLIEEKEDKLFFSKIDSTDIDKLTLRFKNEKLTTIILSFLKTEDLNNHLNKFYTQKFGKGPSTKNDLMTAWKTTKETVFLMTIMNKLALTLTLEEN